MTTRLRQRQPEKWAAAARRGLHLFVITDALLQPLAKAASPKEAVRLWQLTIPRLRARYRELAFEAHPDRGGRRDYFDRIRESWEVVSSDAFAHEVWEQWQLYNQPQQVHQELVLHLGGQAVVASPFSGFDEPGDEPYSNVSPFFWRD